MKKIQMEKMTELPFQMTEALNQLRISLGFSGVEVKSIMVTSSVPDEGKSFVAFQLWKMMAEVGNRVLLIDGDLRNSEMTSHWGFHVHGKMTGIVNGISGHADLDDIIYSTDIPNAYVIPVEFNVPNPTNLLEGSRFDELLKICRKEFDYVIIDSPPLGAVADGLTIGPKTDGVLFVIRSSYTYRKAVENSINLIRRSGVPLLGVVLNRVNVSRKSNKYYYGQYKGYDSYYYGKDH